MSYDYVKSFLIKLLGTDDIYPRYQAGKSAVVSVVKRGDVTHSLIHS